MNQNGFSFFDPTNIGSYSVFSDGKVSTTGNLPKYANTSGLLLTDSGISATAFNDYVKLDGSTQMTASWNTGSLDMTIGNIYDAVDNTYDIGTTSSKKRKMYTHEVETPRVTQPAADNNVVIGTGAVCDVNTSNVLIGNGASIAAAQLLSTVVGFGATSNGNYCTNVGSQNTTSGGSVALGSQVTATGNNSIGVGYLSSVTSDGSVAIGTSSSASSLQATAVGSNAIASGYQYPLALGTYSTASGNQGISIGVLSVASQSDSIAIGSFCVNNTADSCKVGGTGITNIRANSAVCDLGTTADPFKNLYLSGKGYVGLTRPIMSGSFSMITNTSVGPSSNVETNIIGAGVGSNTLAANTLKAGDCWKTECAGTVTIAGGSQIITLRMYGGPTSTLLLCTYPITLQSLTGSPPPWKIQCTQVCKSIGISGTIQINVTFAVNDVSPSQIYVFETLPTLDTTVENVIRCTAQWTTSNASNVFITKQYISNSIFS